MQTYFFSCVLCFQEQSISQSQKDPGCGKQNFIPDPGGLKGTGSAALGHTAEVFEKKQVT
jgi:hypothetical protein